MTDERYKQCKYYRGTYPHTPEDDPSIVGYCDHPLQGVSTDHLVILCRGCPCEEYTPREDGKSTYVLGGIHEPPGMGNCPEPPAWLRAYNDYLSTHPPQMHGKVFMMERIKEYIKKSEEKEEE